MLPQMMRDGEGRGSGVENDDLPVLDMSGGQHGDCFFRLVFDLLALVDWKYTERRKPVGAPDDRPPEDRLGNTAFGQRLNVPTNGLVRHGKELCLLCYQNLTALNELSVNSGEPLSAQ
jgi:hypothetical protein